MGVYYKASVERRKNVTKVSIDKVLLKAKYHVKRGEVESAHRLFLDILKVFPKNKRAKQGLAALNQIDFIGFAKDPSQGIIDDLVANYNEGKLIQVVKQALILIEQYPNSFIVWNLLGAAYKGGGDHDAAMNAFKKVIDLNPSYAAGYNNLGIILKNNGKFEQSIEAFDQALVINPDYPEALNNMALVFKDQGKLKEATILYKKAISLKPDFSEAHNNLGLALHEQGMWEEAIAAFKLALAFKTDFAEAHLNMARTLVEQGDPVSALAACQRALSIKADYAEAYNNMGNAFVLQSKLKDAMISYRKALSLKVNYAEVHYNMGCALKAHGKLDQAIAAYRKALILKPNYAEAYNNMGIALKERGKSSEALKAYKKAIMLKPDLFFAVSNMLKLPYGYLKADDIDFADKVVLENRKKIEPLSKLKFIEAGLLAHGNKFGAAFNKFIEANSLKHREIYNNIQKVKENNFGHYLRINEWVPRERDVSAGQIKKVFILGPSRSGKSLLEGILTQNKKVLANYECINLLYINEIFESKKFMGNVDFENTFFENESELLGKNYDAIVSTNPNSVFIIDKIYELFPDSYFIFVERNEINLASEIFTFEYTKGNSYSYSLSDIKHYLETYNLISKAFFSKVPDQTFRVSYEEITEQTDNISDKLHEFLNIDCDIKKLGSVKPTQKIDSPFRVYFEHKYLRA